VNLLEASKETDVEQPLLASSSSVYEKSKLLPYGEDHPTEPVSPYGIMNLQLPELA
jgi:UDP-glucose 4-epimerase